MFKFHHFQNLFKVILALLAGGLLLQLVAVVAPNVMPYRPSFPYSQELLINSLLPKSIYSWLNFDGVHYLTIIDKGYIGTGLIQAFFPATPILATVFLKIGITPIVGLQLISVCSFAVAVYMFHQLKKLYFPDLHNTWLLVAILTFPTSFSFRAGYTESMFMCLVLGCFLLLAHKKWWWAALVAGLASGTRITGVFLSFSVITTYLFQTSSLHSQHDSIRNYLRSVLTQLTSVVQQLVKSPRLLLSSMGLGIVSISGLILYSLYLFQHFGDPLYFLHVQAEFGAGRQEQLVVWPQVIWRGLKILLTAADFDLHYLIYCLEFLAGAGVLTLVVFYSHIMPLPWLLYSLGVLLLPTLTGTFSSMPRYVLAAFPLFIITGLWLQKSRWFRYLYIPISTLLLIVLTMMFIQGYWVA